MASDNFNFKKFSLQQGRSAFRVGTDGVLLGAAGDIRGVRSILDIGSGTGLIAIMLAQRCHAHITAIEPDKGSFSDLVGNVKNCIWSGNIKTVNISVQNFNPGFKFDLIISNPPWFSNSLRNPDPVKSGARHTDLLTSDDLLSGVDRLIEEEGRFQLILPKTEGDLFISTALKYDFFCNAILKIRSLPSSDISRVIVTFGRKKLFYTETELTVGTGLRHQYTPEYINLTKDFYLKF